MECSVNINSLGPSIFFFILQLYLFLSHSDPKNYSGYNFISAFQQDRKGYAGEALSTNSTEKLLVAKLVSWNPMVHNRIHNSLSLDPDISQISQHCHIQFL